MKNRRFPLGSLLLALATLALTSCTPGAQGPAPSSLDTILSSGIVRVGTTGDFAPMSVKNSNTGAYEGHDIELVEKMAADMGLKVEWVATDWKNLVSGLASGRYDLAHGASYNLGRAKSVGYTLPYLRVGTVALSLKANAARFTSWQSLNSPEIKVATTLGTVFDDQVKSLLPQATRVAVESPARDYQEVLAGRALVNLTSNLEAASLVRTYPELTILPLPAANSNALGFLAPQRDQTWINYVNVWITMNEYNGFLKAHKAKWGIE